MLCICLSYVYVLQGFIFVFKVFSGVNDGSAYSVHMKSNDAFYTDELLKKTRDGKT